MTRRTLGSLLHSADKAYVLSAFPYRMTHESVKQWPGVTEQMRKGGFRYSLISDDQWLSSTTFAVKKDGGLWLGRTHCEHDFSKFRTREEC